MNPEPLIAGMQQEHYLFSVALNPRRDPKL